MTEKDDKQREQKEVGLYEKIAARTAEDIFCLHRYNSS
jgi:hypothetical protein